MYWTDLNTAKIQRANLDGSGVEDLVTSGLSGPLGLALDVGAGKMYWTDWETNKIQRANLDGSGVEDLVTSGLSVPLGLALDVGAGKMYWTDTGTGKIQRANLDGSGVEDLVTSGLNYPFGLALDVGAGKMYWADSNANKIQRANLDGSGVEDLVTSGLSAPSGLALDLGDRAVGTIVTVAGTGTAGYSGDGGPAINAQVSHPAGLAVDAAGNLYFADSRNQRVRKVNLAGGITTLAGSAGERGYGGDGGPATNARLSLPAGVAVDNAGNVYVADYGNSRVRKIDVLGVISTIVGPEVFGGEPRPGTASGPEGLAIDGAGNLFVADYPRSRVLKVDSSGVITTVAGRRAVWGDSGNGGPATEAALGGPQAVAADRRGQPVFRGSREPPGAEGGPSGRNDDGGGDRRLGLLR